jgi:hypothetical protein
MGAGTFSAHRKKSFQEIIYPNYVCPYQDAAAWALVPQLMPAFLVNKFINLILTI